MGSRGGAGYRERSDSTRTERSTRLRRTSTPRGLGREISRPAADSSLSLDPVDSNLSRRLENARRADLRKSQGAVARAPLPSVECHIGGNTRHTGSRSSRLPLGSRVKRGWVRSRQDVSSTVDQSAPRGVIGSCPTVGSDSNPQFRKAKGIDESLPPMTRPHCTHMRCRSGLAVRSPLAPAVAWLGSAPARSIRVSRSRACAARR